ncbi:MAG: lasso peptide biosynthesis PqqD family chaperone [bacterium]|nr:lasso peptide biosynthesis PqqD family chaperone [bacterium]
MSSEKRIQPEATIARNDDIIFSDMGEETVMMSIDKGEDYGLDPVGRRIWELLEKPATVMDIRDDLCTEFNVSAERCAADIMPFMDQLIEKGIINTVDK